MKIKYLAIALLSTILVSSPLMANEKDIHKPLVVKSEIDKATPAAATETDEAETEVEISTRGPGDGKTGQARGHVIGGGKAGHTRSRGDVIVDDISVAKELDKSSPTISPRDAASGMATGKRENSKLDDDDDNDSLTDEACEAIDSNCDTDTSDDSGNSKRAAYMKLGDIKGEATDKAADPSIIKELDKSSTKAASSGYLKIGDIKGESKEVPELSTGAIAGIAVGAVADDDDSEDDMDNASEDDAGDEE